jgi:DNA excision repair protein ERCC-3
LGHARRSATVRTGVAPRAANTALFYTIVSAQTREVDDAWQRQRFLTAQGYTYQVINEEEL